MMKLKHIFYGLVGLSFIVGYNYWLIQRDDALYKAYYKQQAIENLKRPPSSEIR